MPTLTREERRTHVLELHNQGKGTREIAQILQMSFRDIGVFLKDADKQKENEQQQAQQEIQSSSAYKLFSEGKSPVQVAIKLNIKAYQAIIFQREYWDLKGLYELNQIYEEIKKDMWSFVGMNKLIKNAGRGHQHVNRLLEIANNDLPALERRHNGLEQEVKSLEFRRSNLIINSGYYHACCEKEMVQMNRLSNERMRLEDLVTNFKNANEEYLKIKKTVEQKVHSTLSDSKVLLKYALLSLVESMKKDPDRYSSLIYNDIYSSTSTFSVYAAFDIHRLYQHYPSTDSYSDDCLDMLVEEAEKVYNNLVKECVEGSINEYASSTSSLPSLPQRH